MMHKRVSDDYIHFSLMYTTHHIFTVLPIKHLINQDGEPTTPQKLANGAKHSVSNIRVLFFPCVVQKVTAHVDGKAFNMCHQSQKCFRVIFIGIPQYQKGYLIYVHITQKIVSSHDLVFDETFSSVLSYTSHPYSEALAMQSVVLYIPYTTSSHEQTGDIITFAQFEEGDLLENEHNIVEYESISYSLDEYYVDNSYDE